jgi:hypothetical protein
MDDRTLQFAMFLIVIAALYVLVVVGVEIVRRIAQHARIAHPSAQPVVIGADVVHRND